MQLLVYMLLGLVLAFDPVTVSATKVLQCKTTYISRLVEPSVAGNRKLCSLSTNLMDNTDMCITTDTRGDNSGYYSVPDSTPTLCLTVIYQIKNDDFGVDDIVLYRGLSQMSGIINTCEDVCTALSTLIDIIEDTEIYYVGCVTNENGNDEHVDLLNYYRPTNYTCKTPNNYAKKGDPGRPDPPPPFSTQTTNSYPTTIKTRKPTTPRLTTTTKPPVVTTPAPTIITEPPSNAPTTPIPNTEPSTDSTAGETDTTSETAAEETSTEPSTDPTTGEIDTTAETPAEETTSEPSSDSTAAETDPTAETTEVPDTSEATTSADTPFEAANDAANAAAKVAAEVVGKIVKRIKEVQTREGAQTTGAPSWTWHIMGPLAGILAIMVVSLVVELVIARLIFKEVAKVGVASDDVPMS